MYEYMIGQYIKTMTTKDIIQFGKEKGITISPKDAELLLKVAKKDWLTFYKGNPTKIIEELKEKIDPTTFAFGIKLYEEMKKKITNDENS